jgi:single-strand DNA-binding protein
VFGRQAENCSQYLQKGSQVYVEGRIETSQYEKDGQTHYSTAIIANAVQFLDSPGQKQQQSQGGQQYRQQPPQQGGYQGGYQQPPAGNQSPPQQGYQQAPQGPPAQQWNQGQQSPGGPPPAAPPYHDDLPF